MNNITSDIMSKTESFEWVEKKPTIPSGVKGGYLKIIAKTKDPTYHEDETRIFLPEELAANSRSLIGRALTFNHGAEIPDTVIVDSEYNPKEEQIECIAFVPDTVIDRVRKKEIKHSSIEFIWRSLITKGKEAIFKGLSIIGLSLLDIEPGDPNAVVTLFEDGSDKGRLSAIVEIKGEPFAGYTDFADCVSKNQDKGNPEAYCGTIKHQTEGKTLEECKDIVSKIPFDLKIPLAIMDNIVGKESSTEPKKEEPKHSPANTSEDRIKELEEAYTKVVKVNDELKKSMTESVVKAKEEARRETKKEILDDFRTIIPKEYIKNQLTPSSVRLVEELKKRVRKHESEEK